jgi:hypothetical protein
MKIMIILAVFFMLSLIYWGCAKSSPQSKSSNSQNVWKRYKSLADVWPRIKNEKVESISSCDEDPNADVESWYVFYKVPKDKTEVLIEFLAGEAEGDIAPVPDEYRFRRTCQEVFTFVTDKGKYIVPFDEHVPENNWQERVTLVSLWPRLQKESIECIGFCTEERTNIDSWDCWNVPKEHLAECIKIIRNAMQNADPNSFDPMRVNEGRMKIVTNKGKYLVRAEASASKVYGNEWSSSELGQFLMKCGFTASDPKKGD